MSDVDRLKDFAHEGGQWLVGYSPMIGVLDKWRFSSSEILEVLRQQQTALRVLAKMIVDEWGNCFESVWIFGTDDEEEWEAVYTSLLSLNLTDAGQPKYPDDWSQTEIWSKPEFYKAVRKHYGMENNG